MSWVRRTEDTPVHKCDQPMRERWINVPSGSMNPDAKTKPLRMPDAPNGRQGDLWRCGCGRLWRIGLRPIPGRGGYIGGGLEWLPATWWQRLRHHRRGYGSLLDPDIWVTTESVNRAGVEGIEP